MYIIKKSLVEQLRGVRLVAFIYLLCEYCGSVFDALKMRHEIRTSADEAEQVNDG